MQTYKLSLVIPVLKALIMSKQISGIIIPRKYIPTEQSTLRNLSWVVGDGRFDKRFNLINEEILTRLQTPESSD